MTTSSHIPFNNALLKDIISHTKLIDMWRKETTGRSFQDIVTKVVAALGAIKTGSDHITRSQKRQGQLAYAAVAFWSICVIFRSFLFNFLPFTQLIFESLVLSHGDRFFGSFSCCKEFYGVLRILEGWRAGSLILCVISVLLHCIASSDGRIGKG